jgi:hypothetical protein
MEITTRVIDLGDRVIQLRNVASVRVGTVHPLRPLAGWPFVVAVLLVLFETFGPETPSPNSFGLSGIIALALGLFAAAAVCYLYRIRRLVVMTTDSLAVFVQSPDPTFLHLVLQSIRSAMSATDPSFRVSIDLMARTLEANGDRDSAEDLQAPPLHADAATDRRDWADRGPEPMLPTALGGTAPDLSPHPSLSPLNGAAAPEGRSRFAEAILRETHAMEPAGSARKETESPAPAKGQIELEAVIDLIDHANLQHKAELHALLDPVRDHLFGGRTSRRDATRNWELFHDYAKKYLADVDGLAESCRRVQATLQ